MSYKFFIYLFFLSVTITGHRSATTTDKQDDNKPDCPVNELLKHPLGTLLKMEIEIFDGNLTQRKEYQGAYLFKIKTVDNQQLADTLLMTFKDETGKFPTNDFELYKYLYGRNIGSISSGQVDKMKKKYVGKVFHIVAYETGGFTGVPKGYFEYQPIRTDQEFHFQNYLVVVGDLTKP